MLKDYYLEALEETQKSLQKGKQIWLTNASFLKEGNNSITLAFPSKMYLTNFNNFCKSELQSKIDSLTGSHIDIETECCKAAQILLHTPLNRIGGPEFALPAA